MSLSRKSALLFLAVMGITAIGLTLLHPVAQAGNGAPSGAHYNLNIIGVPKGKTASMTNSDRRTIFVPLSGACSIKLVVGDFSVKDGNCTDGSATFQLPNPDATSSGTTTYSVFARALGKPGGSAKSTTCATDPSDGALVCSESSLTLTRKAGRTQFSNVSKQLLYIYNDYNADGTLDRLALFDSRLTDYFWAWSNTGLKLAQLRFYGCSSTVPTNPDGTTASTCAVH